MLSGPTALVCGVGEAEEMLCMPPTMLGLTITAVAQAMRMPYFWCRAFCPMTNDCSSTGGIYVMSPSLGIGVQSSRCPRRSHNSGGVPAKIITAQIYLKVVKSMMID